VDHNLLHLQLKLQQQRKLQQQFKPLQYKVSLLA
jgi:hypothetical protein